MMNIKIDFIVKRKEGTVKKSFPYKQAVKLLQWEAARSRRSVTLFEIDPTSEFTFHNGDIIKKQKESPTTKGKKSPETKN